MGRYKAGSEQCEATVVRVKDGWYGMADYPHPLYYGKDGGATAETSGPLLSRWVWW